MYVCTPLSINYPEFFSGCWRPYGLRVSLFLLDVLLVFLAAWSDSASFAVLEWMSDGLRCDRILCEGQCLVDTAPLHLPRLNLLPKRRWKKTLIPRVVGLFVSRNKDTSPGVPGIPRCARCSFCIYGDIQTVFSMPWWFASRSDLASIALKKYFAVYRDSVTCLNCALACNAFFRRFLTLTARQGQLYNPTHLLIEHDVVDAANGTSWSCESPTLSCLEAPPFFGPTHPNWIESLPAGQVLQLTMYLSTAASGDASLSSLVASRCRLSLPLLRFPLSSLPSFAQDPLPLSPLLAPRSSLSRSYCTVTAPAPPLQEIIVPSFNERPSSLMLAFLGCRSQACMPLW